MMLRCEQTSITHGVENGRIPIDEKAGKGGIRTDGLTLKEEGRNHTVLWR